MMKAAAKKMKQRSAGKPDIELGKRIRLRRVEQKISQAELGDKLGVSFQQVQKYEKGVNRVGAARLQSIATALAACAAIADELQRLKAPSDASSATVAAMPATVPTNIAVRVRMRPMSQATIMPLPVPARGERHGPSGESR